VIFALLDTLWIKKVEVTANLVNPIFSTAEVMVPPTVANPALQDKAPFLLPHLVSLVEVRLFYIFYYF
jgi:hypothetical protein